MYHSDYYYFEMKGFLLMEVLKETEKKVLEVYKKANPSTFFIENSTNEFNARMNFMENLYLHRLKFPPKMFKNAQLLDLGTGTGENSLYYLLAGALCTFVEMNHLACKRADMLFKKFAPDSSEYQIVNQSLFDYKSDKTYDIVISLGVIHHTADKKKSFEIQSSFLKKGGFLILGIGNTAGFFQRNLQRAIIYNFAQNENEIVALAEELFHEHIDRAVKYGGRERKSIIYDSYINPKIDTPSISEILNWFSNNNLVLYSSWPPIIPAVLADSPNRKLIQFEKFSNLLSIPEIIYLSHCDDDEMSLIKNENLLKMSITPFIEFVDLLNNVEPDSDIKYSDILIKIKTFMEEISNLNPYAFHLKNTIVLLEEIKLIINALQEGHIESVKNCIKNSKRLFKGTCGIGMNWYVAYKQ